MPDIYPCPLCGAQCAGAKALDAHLDRRAPWSTVTPVPKCKPDDVANMAEFRLALNARRFARGVTPRQEWKPRGKA